MRFTCQHPDGAGRFSLDGRWLLASCEGSETLWSVARPREPIPLWGASVAAFTGDGHLVLVGGGELHELPLDADALQQHLRARTRYCPPPEVRQRVLAEPLDVAQEAWSRCVADQGGAGDGTP